MVLDRIMGIKRVLLPGPIDIPEDILQYSSLKPISHRSKDFIDLLSSIIDNLRIIMGIGKEDHIIIIPGSSTIGIEAVFSNIIYGNTRVLVLEYGFFGYRIREIISRYTNNIVSIKYKFPSIPNKYDILNILEKENYDIVALVHNETSIGYVIRFLPDIAKIVHEKNAYLVLDGVSSIGAEEFRLTEWGIDAVITGSQKALGGLPGLSIIGFSNRVYERIQNLRNKGHKVPFYFDIIQYLEEYSRYGWIPTTPPINSLYVLSKSLERIVDMGIDWYLDLHRTRAMKVYEYAFNKGLRPIVMDDYYRSNSVAVFYVENALSIVDEIRMRHGILLAPGVGEYRNKMIRIGMMGFIELHDIIEAIDLVLKYASW